MKKVINETLERAQGPDKDPVVVSEVLGVLRGTSRVDLGRLGAPEALSWGMCLVALGSRLGFAGSELSGLVQWKFLYSGTKNLYDSGSHRFVVV